MGEGWYNHEVMWTLMRDPKINWVSKLSFSVLVGWRWLTDVKGKKFKGKERGGRREGFGKGKKFIQWEGLVCYYWGLSEVCKWERIKRMSSFHKLNWWRQLSNVGLTWMYLFGKITIYLPMVWPKFKLPTYGLKFDTLLVWS